MQLLQQQQAQAQAQQQANELLRQELAELRRAQAQPSSSSSSRSVPKFDPVPFKGEGEQVESWIRAARIRVDCLPDDYAKTEKGVKLLAQGFSDAALVWYSETVCKSSSFPSSPQALFDLVRAQYQPQVAADVAYTKWVQLKQGKGTVSEYTQKFMELVALMGTEGPGVATQLRQYRLGLSSSIVDRIVAAPTQPTTLREAQEVAARIESNAKHAQTGLAAMEVEEPGSSSSPSDSKLMLAALTSIQRTLQRNSSTGGRREGAEGSRNREKSRGRRTLNPKLEKQSREQRGKLMDQGRCIYCAAPDHLLRDCPVSAAGKDPTPAALGN
jgi:hypothetical protein